MNEPRDLGFGAEPVPLSAWFDAGLAAMSAWAVWTMASASLGTSLFSNALAQRPGSAAGHPSLGNGRSWYRPPLDPVYDLAAWFPALRSANTALDWWQAATRLPSAWASPGAGSLDMTTAWATAMVAFSLPLAAQLLANSASPVHQWTQLAFSWPGHERREETAPFAVYRSDGGHATAQITFPKIVVAATVWPVPGFPFWRLM